MPRSVGTRSACPRRIPDTWARLTVGLRVWAPRRTARPRISRSLPWVTGTGKWGMPRGCPRSPGLARSIPRLDALGLTQVLPPHPLVVKTHTGNRAQEPLPVRLRHAARPATPILVPAQEDENTCPHGNTPVEVRGSLTRAKRWRRPGVHGGMNGPTAAGQPHDGA